MQEDDTPENDATLRAEQLTVLSHHLLAVSEQEKATLARELHDELGSNLMAIQLDLSAAIEKLKKSDPALAVQLQETSRILKKTFDIKRRIIENLRPSSLEHLGFAAAIRSHSDEVAVRSGLQIDVDIEEDATDIDSTRAIAMFRIVQESLTNAVKYAQASHIFISLARNEKRLRLRIADDGIGCAEERIRKPKSHGIVGMRERAILLGGTFSVTHNSNGYGTCIDVSLPIAPD